MASKELGPDGVEIWRSKASDLRLWSPGAGILCSAFSGDVSEELAPPFIAHLQRIVAQSPRTLVFVDTDRMVNYETGLRVRLTEGLRQSSGRIETVHVFVHSKVVGFAVQAANIVLRNIAVHSSRQSFEAALGKAVAERARGR